jgi:hypothetical protein
MTKRVFEFTLWLADDPRELDDWSHAVFVAGGDDSTCGMHCGRLCASFHREAESLEDAIRSAHQTVRTAGLSVLRCEIEPEQMAAWSGA